MLIKILHLHPIQHSIGCIMNAFLQYQAQLEEQFLNQLDHSSFQSLCNSHISFFKAHLQPSFAYTQFCKRTGRAKNPLQLFDDLITYITLYGMAHYQRMTALFEYMQENNHIQPTQPIKACVIDYGCGQGIATLALLEHIIQSQKEVEELKIVLIEPSAHALRRAINWIEKKAKSADINISITAHACTFDELDDDFLAQINSSYENIHLFSNILDMYAANKFSLDHLCHKIKVHPAKHTFFAISPDFYTGNWGFDALDHLLKPKTTFLNERGTVTIDEYHYTSSLMQKRNAPVRAYIAQL